MSILMDIALVANDPTISDKVKIAILIHTYGLSREDAKKIIKDAK